LLLNSNGKLGLPKPNMSVFYSREEFPRKLNLR
jgi:hypothetical protein